MQYKRHALTLVTNSALVRRNSEDAYVHTDYNMNSTPWICVIALRSVFIGINANKSCVHTRYAFRMQRNDACKTGVDTAARITHCHFSARRCMLLNLHDLTDIACEMPSDTVYDL